MSRHRLEVADVFRQHEQEFLSQGRRLSAPQLRAFRDICACRTAALGSHIEQCDDCSRQVIAYDSCRNRHCPKCQSSARDKWLLASLKPDNKFLQVFAHALQSGADPSDAAEQAWALFRAR